MIYFPVLLLDPIWPLHRQPLTASAASDANWRHLDLIRSDYCATTTSWLQRSNIDAPTLIFKVKLMHRQLAGRRSSNFVVRLGRIRSSSYWNKKWRTFFLQIWIFKIAIAEIKCGPLRGRCWPVTSRGINCFGEACRKPVKLAVSKRHCLSTRSYEAAKPSSLSDI